MVHLCLCTVNQREISVLERYTGMVFSFEVATLTLGLQKQHHKTVTGDDNNTDDARLCQNFVQVGIEVKFKGMHYPVLISPARVPELHAITRGSSDNGGVSIGGAASLSSVEHALAVIDGRKTGAGGGNGGAAGACVDMLRWFASTQIRNVACLAGEKGVLVMGVV